MKEIILSIHYHKTGCVLSQKLYNLFNNELDNNIYHVKNPVIRRKFVTDTNNNFVFPIIKFEKKKKYNIFNQAGPNFFYNIHEKMPMINKIVHFIREPYDHCISNFLYHIQYPTPEKVGIWIEKPLETNIDSWFDKKALTYMIEEIGLNSDDIYNLFYYLKKIYKCPKNKSYYDYLKSLPLEDGLVIVTIHFILTFGDPLRLALITKKLKNCDNVITVYMSDFRDNPNLTINKLGKFLFPNDITDKKIKRIIDNYKLDYNNNKNKKSTSHVTQGKISTEKRKELYNKLKSIPEIKKILDKVYSIIYN